MFDIQVDKKDLKAALDCISATVGDNSQNLGDDCVSITDEGNGFLTLYTNNNSIEYSEVAIVLSSSSQTREKLPNINFKRFKQIIDSVPDGEYINIKQASTNEIEINYGNRKKPIKLSVSVNGISPIPTVNGVEMNFNKNIIAAGLNGASSIIKDDGTNSLTNCMRVYGDNFNVEITAADVKNSRMMLYKGTNTEINSGDVLLEVSKLKKAFKMFENFDDVVITTSPSFIKITSDTPSKSAQNMSIFSATYYVRALSGAYPNNIAAMFNQAQNFVSINKAEMEGSLSRANAIEDTTVGSDTMDLTVGGGFVNVVKSSQYGIVEDSFDVANSAQTNLTDSFRIKPFLEVIKALPDKAVNNASYENFEIGEIPLGNSYVIRNENSSDGYQYLITGQKNSSTTP